MKSFNSKRKFQKRTNKKSLYRNKKKVSIAVKKYVNKSIHRNIENKMITTYANNNSITGTSFVLPLTPLVSQGTGQSGRVGNKINLLSACLKFVVNLVPYNITTNPAASPVMFRWMLITQLNSNGSTLSLSNFFQINNSSIGIQGNHLDLLLNINRDLYKVHKQGKFRLGVSSNSTGFPAANVSMEAGKFSLEKILYFNKYLHKKILYDDTIVTPQNTNLWFILFPVYAHGSSNSGYTNANISYVYTHTFEDA